MSKAVPIFDVGFELEYFLTKGQNVYNASKVMHEALGFSIDQNASSVGAIDLGNGLRLRTDGTAMEAQWFYKNYYGGLIHQATFWNALSSVKACQEYERSLKAFYRDGVDGCKLINPGNVFASEKEIINAYTGKSRMQEKKMDDKKVTIRTAGLHFHFSINKSAFPSSVRDERLDNLNKIIFGKDHKHTNALVKILDQLYQEQFRAGPSVWFFSTESLLRVDNYQTLGDYRIKADTETGNPTLEYRQLDSEMMYFPKLMTFLTEFQIRAEKYITNLYK